MIRARKRRCLNKTRREYVKKSLFESLARDAGLTDRYVRKVAASPLLAPGCNPKLNFLDDLKAVAERSKLDKENFWLHKFRATFATWSLWAGVDLRTVQQWLGHSDMESTMRYLKPSRSQHVRDKVNEIFAGS